MRKFYSCLAAAFILLNCLICLRSWSQNSIGNFRTKNSGNWSNFSTWQVRIEEGWTDASISPSVNDIVSIQNGHTVVVDVNSAVGDIYLNTSGVIACGNNILSVYGTLYAYTGVTVITNSDAVLTASTAPSNGNITCLSSGRFKFVGNSRSISVNGYWGANGLVTSAIIEFALNEGQTGTLNTSFKANTLIITSGIVDMLTNRLAPDNNSSAGGTLIMNGGILVSSASGTSAGSQVISRVGSGRCGNVIINNGATLRMLGLTPCIDADALTITGTVEYARSGSQTFLQKSGQDQAAIDITAYNHVVLSGNHTKTTAPSLITTVNGTLTNNTGFALGTSSSLIFSANSHYVHAINGGTIPTATWSSSSTCSVTGFVGTAPSGLGQSFGNFTWKNEGQTSPCNINNNNFSVAGTLSVQATNTSYLALVGSTNNSHSNTIGGINVSGGAFNLNFLSSSSGGTATISVANDITASGGTFNFAAGTANPSTATSITSLNLGGNLTIAAGANFWQSNPGANVYSTLNFSKNGLQTIAVNNGSGNRGSVDYVIQPLSRTQLLTSLVCASKNRCFVNGILDVQNFTVSGSSTTATFTIGSGGKIITANAGGVAASITVAGTKTFSAGASYEFNGTADQSTGFSGVTINAPAAVLINNTGGKVIADANMTFGNNASLIVGENSIFDANTRTYTFGTGGLVEISGTVQTANTSSSDALSGSATSTVSSTNNPSIGLGNSSTVEYNSTLLQHIASRDFNGHLKINNTSGVRMNGSIITGGTLMLTSGGLAINGHTLTLNGSISGPGTLSGSPTSNLVIGAAAGTLNFEPGAQVLRGFTLHSGASATLGTPLSITAGSTPGTVTVNSNATLTTNGQLTLRSDAIGTASVAPSAGTIAGNVTVERFIAIPATSRRYRLLTAPVKGTSINASWQEGRTFDGTSFSPSAPPVGYGTMITGQAQGSSATANSNGFDFWDAVSNNVASIRYYQGASSSSAAQWRAPVTTTFTNAFDRQQAYLLFIRGDRGVYSGTNPGATILRATGELKQGDTVSATLYGKAVQSHTLLGNPYAAPLEFKSLAADNSSKIENYFWTWNAAQGNSTGAYAVAIPDDNSPGHYEIIPHPSPTSSSANSIIPSGQGFFVVPKPEQTENTTLLFKESYKAVTSPGVQLFRQQRIEAPTSAKLYINLNSLSAGGEKTLLDGVLAQFSNLFESSPKDIGKAANGSENLALAKGSSNLIVASQPAPKTGDVLQLRLWNTTVRDYSFDIQGQNFSTMGVNAVLEDSFTGIQKPLSLAGDLTPVNFSITTDAASKNPLRFRIVFTSATVLPLQVTTVRTQEKNGKLVVTWIVENETGIQGYEVEKSADAQQFQFLTAVKARGTAGTQVYETADNSPSPVNYYRIKMLGITGEVKQSAVVRADWKSPLASLQIYPNPITGRLLHVQLQNKPEGLYHILLFNTAGQMVAQKQVQHAGGSQTSVLTLPSTIAKGLYRLEVRNSKSGKEVTNLMVE